MAKLSQKWFRDPVVLALGELCDFEPGIGIPRRDVVDRVLENTDIDEMAEGYSPSKKSKPQIALWIEHAFRNQRGGRYNKRNAKTISIDPANWRTHGGLWGLTELGVRRALELAEANPSSGNGGGGNGGGGNGGEGNGGGGNGGGGLSETVETVEEEVPLLVVEPDTEEDGHLFKVEEPVVEDPVEEPVVEEPVVEEPVGVETIFPVVEPDITAEDIEVVPGVAEEIAHELAQDEVVCQTEETIRIVEEEPETPSTNLTGQYLGDHWEECWSTMLAAVRKRWKRSDDLGLVEDHVSIYVTNLINRDGLRKHILDPEFKLSSRHLAFWCAQDCVSQQHRWGRDPSARTLRNAKTRFDLNNKIDARIDPDLSGRFVWNTDRGIQSFAIVDNAHEAMLDHLSMKEAMGKMEDIIHDNMKSGAAERYVSILRSMVEDECSIVDVAEQEQVTRNRAASIIGTLRSLLRGAQRVGYLEGYLN